MSTELFPSMAPTGFLVDELGVYRQTRIIRIILEHARKEFNLQCYKDVEERLHPIRQMIHELWMAKPNTRGLIIEHAWHVTFGKRRMAARHKTLQRMSKVWRGVHKDIKSINWDVGRDTELEQYRIVYGTDVQALAYHNWMIFFNLNCIQAMLFDMENECRSKTFTEGKEFFIKYEGYFGIRYGVNDTMAAIRDVLEPCLHVDPQALNEL